MTSLDLGGDSSPPSLLPQDPPAAPPLPQQDPPEANIRQRLAALRVEDRRLRDEQLFSAVKNAVETEPDMDAAAQKLAASLNMPVGVALRDMGFARRMAKIAYVRDETFRLANPVLADRLQDLRFAKIAHDDIERLSITERFWKGFDAGRRAVDRGLLGQKIKFGRADEGERMFADMLSLAAQEHGAPHGFAGNTGQFAGNLFQTLPLAAADAITTATGATLVAAPAALGPQGIALPAVAATAGSVGFATSLYRQSYRTIAGNDYLDMVGKGYSHSQAANWSEVSGAVGASLDLVGLGLIGQGAKAAIAPLRAKLLGEARKRLSEAITEPTRWAAAWNVVKRWGTGTAGETATEMGQDLVSFVTEEQARRGDPARDKLSSTISKGTVMDRLVDTMVATFQGASIISGAGPLVAFRYDLARAAGVEEAQKAFRAIGADASESALNGRAPSVYASTVQQMAEGTDGQTVLVKASEFVKALQQSDIESADAGKLTKSAAESLNELMPETMASVEGALQADDYVEIPSGDYAAYIAGKPLDAKLLPHVKFDREKMSFVEKEEFAANAPGILKALEPVAKKAFEDNIAFTEDGDKLEEFVKTQVDAAVKSSGAIVTPNQREVFASMARRVYERIAQSQGRLPSQLKPLRITDEAVPGEAVPGEAVPGEDPNILPQPGRGAFNPATNTIHLTATTDASTLMHEMMHAAWEMMLALPERGDLQGGINEMFTWFGITEDQWSGLEATKRVPYHEQLAVSFEKFLAEGKAPTVELQPLFERIAQWIRDIYKDVVGRINAAYKAQFGRDLPALTPEVRRFFGSMLASEQVIAETEATRGRMAAFDQDTFPGPAEDWAEYQALVLARTQGGIAKLTATQRRNIAWLDRSESRLAKEVAKEARELRKAAGVEAKKEVELQAVYRLRTWLKTDAAKGEGLNRLNVDDIKSIFGDEAQEVLTALGDDNVREGGHSVDAVAEQLGFPGGEAMVRVLLEAPTMADAIEARIDEIMLRDHGTLRDAAEQAMAVEEALANDAAVELAYKTLSIAQQAEANVNKTAAKTLRLKNTDRLTKAAMHEIARQRLAATPVGKIKARSYSLAATQAEREAATAFGGRRASKGKDGAERPAKAPSPEEGIRLLQQSLLNTEMARQALKIEKEVAKTIERQKKHFFAGDTKLAKKHNLDWVHVGQAIMAGYSMEGRRQLLPLEYLASLGQYDPLLHAQLLDFLPKNTLQHYQDLPYSEFTALADGLDALWEQSQRYKQLMVLGKMEEKDAAKAKIIAQLITRLQPGADAIVSLADASAQSSKLSTSLAQLRKVEHIFQQMDGGRSDGPLQRYFWTTLRQALDSYHLERKGAMDELNAIFKGLADKNLLGRTRIDLTQFLGIGPVAIFEDTAQLLGVLQDIGNASNLQNRLLGEGWGEMVGEPGDERLDTSRWDAALQHLHDNGHIKKEHIDALAAIGKINERLKVAAQKVNKEAYGAYFKEVEIKPIKTPWGDYDGWYAPSAVDMAREKNPQLVMSNVDTESPLKTATRNATRAAPAVKHAWTLTRTGGAHPRVMDLMKQAQHFDEMLRFIHLQIPLRDVWSMVMDKDIYGLFQKIQPGFVDNVLKPMLDDMALGSMSKPGVMKGVMDNFFTFITRSTSRALMFGSISAALQQWTGIAAVVPYAGVQRTWGALQRVRRMGLKGSGKYIEGKSKAFQVRRQEHHGSQLQDADALLNYTKRARLNQAVDAVTYWGIQTTQNMSDMVAWIAGYDKAIAEHPTDEAAAVAAGDSTVRLSQSSRTTMDTAAIERSSPEWKMALQFTHYWINVLSVVTTNDQKMKTAFWGAVLPTLAGAAIAGALRGGDDWEDDETGEITALSMAKWLSLTGVRGGGSLFPVVGPIATSVLFSKPGMPLSPFPAWSGVEATGHAVNNMIHHLLYIMGNDAEEGRVARSRSGATTGQGLRDLGLAISFWSGFPVARVFKALGYVEDRADQKTDTGLFLGLTGTAR